MATRGSSLWTKAIRILAQEGFGQFLKRAVAKVSSPLLEFGSVTFFLRELEQALPEARPALKLHLRQASASDLDLVLAASDPSRSLEALQRRLRRGDLCFIAITEDGRVANSRWVATSRARIPELGRDLILRSNEAYIYDSYTHPDFRRCGVDGAVRRFVLSHLRSAGFQKAYSYVRGDNPVGLRAVRRWQEPAAKLWYIHLRGFRPWVFGRPRGATLVLSRGNSGQNEEK